MVRPTKFSQEVALSILNHIKAGNNQDVAAQASGIDPSTFYNWQKRANKGDKTFAPFFEEVKKARAEAESRNVIIIQTAAEKSWQAAAWWLERHHPDRWARKDGYRIEVEKPQSIQIIIEGEDDDRERTENNIPPTSQTNAVL